MESNKAWFKIIGWVLAGAIAVAGWIYAGIMSGYTARIVKLETETNNLQVDVQAIQMQSVRFEEMFKTMNSKLDVIIAQHLEDSRKK